MKQINKMSRLTNELEKAFNLLNADIFGGELPTPIITVIPTPRAYAHYVPFDIWETKDCKKREINIASGTLDRPLENILASLVHEMVHMYNDVVLNEADTSNKGVYHNKIFKREAESHWLIVSRSERYGYSHTEPSEKLLEWLLEHDELREIEMCRANPLAPLKGVGARTGSFNGSVTAGTALTSHHRKYICPCCGNSVRATKAVNIMCMDCNKQMIEA